MKNISVIACCYKMSPDRLRNKLNELAKQIGVVMCGYIVVNNTDYDLFNDSKWISIRGSNEELDFSAYIEGLNAHENDHGSLPQSILFINDTLFTAHNAKANILPVIKLAPLLDNIKLPSIVGKADKYITICHLNPWGGQAFYISTYCFLLNRGAFSILKMLPKLADEDGLTHDRTIDTVNWGYGLRPSFREFLRANVVYSDSPYSWHAMQKFKANILVIQKKVRCIYFEHRLSGELFKDGCILPINTSISKKLYLRLAESYSRFLNRLI